jgi:hypothetical protein
MKLLLIVLLFPVTGMGQGVSGGIGGPELWPGTKSCQHIYVAVEETELQPTEKLTKVDSFANYSGKLIVCVKCHHLKKQVIGYGRIGGTGGYVQFADHGSGWLRLSSTSRFRTTADLISVPVRDFNCITGVDKDGCTIYGSPENPQTNHKYNCPNRPKK